MDQRIRQWHYTHAEREKGRDGERSIERYQVTTEQDLLLPPKDDRTTPWRRRYEIDLAANSNGKGNIGRILTQKTTRTPTIADRASSVQSVDFGVRLL